MRHALPLLILASMAAGAGPAWAQRGTVYCNVTAVTSEQLSNGVRVTIEADGELHWGWDFERLIEEGALREYEGGGLRITEKFRRLSLRLHNARSKLGSAFIPINKYPVSHVEIRIPEWAEEGVGLGVDVVNYLGLITGEGRFERWRGDWWLMSSEDRSSIVILWESDRFPPAPSPETPADLPTELEVKERDGLLTIRAVNVRLHDLANAIGREAGLSVTSPAEDDIRVSLCLRDVSPATALDAIATGCGLCTQSLPGGRWVIAAPTGSAGAYGAGESRRVQLKYLRAVDALDLLPNFLMQYLRPDEGSNSIVVTGPGPLADRVAEDLAKLDVPSPEVLVEVVTVEYTSGHDLARALQLERYLGDFGAALDSLTGDLGFLWLEGLPQGWAAVLNNVETDTSTKLISRASARVLNGHNAFIGAGEEYFVIFEYVEESFVEAYLGSAWTTSFISVQPLVGRGDEVILGLGVVARTLRGRDPRTDLPIVGLRRAGATVRIRDGQTIVLGGIVSESEDEQERSIPILGDLPIIGGLFRSVDRTRSHTRLAFFVTSHIIRPDADDSGGSVHG
jgi:hypothetical protein